MLYIKNNAEGSEINFAQKTLLSHQSALCYIKRCCEIRLFCYASRLAMTKKYCHIKYKTPLLLSPEVILIPTTSPKKVDCIWLNAFEIERIEPMMKKTKIIFRTGQILEVTPSIYAIKRQLEQAKCVYRYMVDNSLNDCYCGQRAYILW